MVLALIALVVATLAIDPDIYRPAVQRQLSEAIGRDVSIERLAVGRSLRPTIAVTGVRIANAPWATQPQLISVNHASVRLDLLSLIRGEIEIGNVDVDGVELSLERDSNGIGNWELSSPDTKAAGDKPATLPDFDRISLQDVNVSWRNVDGETTVVQVPSLEATLRARRPLRMNATVVYRKVPIRAQLDSRRSLQSVLAGGPVSASLALDAVQTHLDLSINLTSLSDFRHVQATVAANGERIGALSALLDRDLPDWGPYAVSGKLAVNDGRVDVSGLRLAVDGLPGNAPFAIHRVTVNSGLVSLGSDIATTVTLSGSLDDLDFVLDATSADLSSFSGDLQRLPLAVSMRVSGLRLGADGELRFASGAFTFDFATHIKGDVRPLARIFQSVEMIRPLEVDVSSSVSGDQHQVSLQGLKGAVAGCSVDGELAVQYSPHIRVNGGLVLGRLDVAAFDVFAKPSRTPPAEKSKKDSSAWLSALDADLRLRVGEIAGLPVTASDLSGRGILRDGRLAVQEFRGLVNATPLLVTAALQYRGNRPHVDADISLPVLDLERLSGPATRNETGEKTNSKGALDSSLPIAALRDFDADLKVELARIKGSPVSAKRLRASASLQRGHLQVSSLDATTAGITSRSTFTLDATLDDARLNATSHSSRIVLAELFKELDVKSQVLGRLGDATVTIETHGTTLRNWLRNAKARASIGVSNIKLRDRNEELDIEQASIVAGPDVPVQAELRGKVEQYPLQLSATGGPLVDLLLAGTAWPQISAEIHTEVRKLPVEITASSAFDALKAGRDVPVRVEVRSENGSAIAVGTIADMQNPERTPLDVQIRMKSLKRTPWKPEELALPDIPFAATAKITVGEKLIALDNLKLTAGDTDLAGSLRMNRENRLNLAADLSANLLDLKPWIPKSDAKVETVEKVESSKAAEKVEGATASDPGMDKPFNLEPMRKIDVALTFRARRVTSHQMDVDDLVVNTKLNKGLLDFSTSITEGETTFKGRVDGRTDVPALAVRLKTTKLNLDLLKPEGFSVSESTPKITANAQFAGAGATPRAIYNSAKGVAVISTGPGQIGTSGSPFLVQTVSTSLLEVLLPGRKPEDFNQLECAAARFEVKDGVANSPNGIAFRFKRMDILGSGAVNLATGKILFGFKAVRRHWFDFSILSVASDFASITGTVDKPRVGLDTQGALITGGAAWATAGLSLLATNFLRTLSSSEDPCTAILEKGRTASDPIDALMKSLQLPNKP